MYLDAIDRVPFDRAKISIPILSSQPGNPCVSPPRQLVSTTKSVTEHRNCELTDVDVAPVVVNEAIQFARPEDQKRPDMKFHQCRESPRRQPQLKPVRKRRTSAEPNRPRRPLSAYNIFYSEERDRSLHELEGLSIPQRVNNKDHFKTHTEDLPKVLLKPLLPVHRRKRDHKKTHGKISFLELVRIVSKRWKAVPQDRRKYYEGLAAQDKIRQLCQGIVQDKSS